jgi:hypothetical protein
VDSLYSPVGCDACDHSGYRGRVGIYEVLVFDDAIREAVRAEEKGDQLRVLAQAMGMKLMQEDALDKVLRGITSIDEVARVVPVQTASSIVCQICLGRTSRSFTFCPHCGARQNRPAANPDTNGQKPVTEAMTRI